MLNMYVKRGVSCHVVRVVDLESLAPPRCVFLSSGTWIISCEEAIQLVYETSVILLRCLLLPEIMHEGAPDVFLHY